MPCFDLDVMQQCQIAETNNVLDVAKAMSGLTKREYAAIKAMQGLISADHANGSEKIGTEDISTMAVDYADHLLEALEDK